ncbi:MAG: hypothetical protein IH599_01565, partial [Bacteroidales bacterium]|nr:hypothetical protein [Bacteroidales bacterium]
MTEQSAERIDFDSTGFILFMYRWRRLIIGAVLIAILGSVIFSSPWFLPPKFKSTVVMFPVSSNSISKALLSENFGGKTDILEFGEEEQAEQMLQMLGSNRIRESVIRTYDLMQHYGIDTGSRYSYTRLYREYDRNISFRRTEFMAVEISVLDTDPQMAANIANLIAALLDSTKNEMQRQRAEKAYRIVEAEYLNMRRQVQEMEDSLTYLRQQGVHDYESQAEMINQQLAIEIARGNTAGIRALEEKLDMLATYGGPYVSLRDELEHEKKQLSLIKAKYEEAKVDAEQELPQKFLVNTAYKAEKKSYPIRWLIVSVTTILVFILVIFILVLVENFRQVPWKKKRTSAFRVTSPRGGHPPEQPSEPPDRQPPQQNDSPIAATNEQHQKTIINTGTREYQPAEPPEIKETRQMANYTDNMNLLQLVIKWRRHLAVIGVLAAVLAILVSSPLVIKPRFKSFATLYPSNIWPYSDESESEQMLQLLNSTEVRDSVIGRFDLTNHYGLKPGDKYYRSTLNYMYSRYVKIRKTEFEA